MIVIDRFSAVKALDEFGLSYFDNSRAAMRTESPLFTFAQLVKEQFCTFDGDVIVKFDSGFACSLSDFFGGKSSFGAVVFDEFSEHFFKECLTV